jgi:HK97 family phage major capsid protein
VNKPSGLLTYVVGGSKANAHPGGPIDVLEAAIKIDALTDFLYGLAAPYRQNATWLMLSLTAVFIAKLKGADGRQVWRESLIVGQPATLLGRPVEIDEGMPAPLAGNLAVLFGDLKTGATLSMTALAPASCAIRTRTSLMSTSTSPSASARAFSIRSRSGC